MDVMTSKDYKLLRAERLDSLFKTLGFHGLDGSRWLMTNDLGDTARVKARRVRSDVTSGVHFVLDIDVYVKPWTEWTGKHDFPREREPVSGGSAIPMFSNKFTPAPFDSSNEGAWHVVDALSADAIARDIKDRFPREVMPYIERVMSRDTLLDWLRHCRSLSADKESAWYPLGGATGCLACLLTEYGPSRELDDLIAEMRQRLGDSIEPHVEWLDTRSLAHSPIE